MIYTFIPFVADKKIDEFALFAIELCFLFLMATVGEALTHTAQTVGPTSVRQMRKRRSNGVSLEGRWWSAFRCLLGKVYYNSGGYPCIYLLSSSLSFSRTLVLLFFVCLFDLILYVPVNNFCSYVGTCLPVLNQY